MIIHSRQGEKVVPHCGVAINDDNDVMLSQSHSMLVSWDIS